MVPLAFLDLGLLWVLLASLSRWLPGVVEPVVFVAAQETLWYRPERAIAANVLAASSLVLLAPGVEACIFRGWLLPIWSPRWGARVAVAATSVLFGVLHGQTALAGCLFGLVATLLYLRSGSLAVPIAAHVTMNAIAASSDLVGRDVENELTGAGLLEALREDWWVGALGMVVGAPVVGCLLRPNWPRPSDESTTRQAADRG
jgi:membrane protease YdiL (CAAX protease family)